MDEYDEDFLKINFSKTALLEFNANKWGIAIVGNVEGYLALARFCTFMAQLQSEIQLESNGAKTNINNGEGGYHFAQYIPGEAIASGRFIFSPGPLSNIKEDVQDVEFFVSNQIGPLYWKSTVESKTDPEWLEGYSYYSSDIDEQEN